MTYCRLIGRRSYPRAGGIGLAAAAGGAGGCRAAANLVAGLLDRGNEPCLADHTGVVSYVRTAHAHARPVHAVEAREGPLDRCHARPAAHTLNAQLRPLRIPRKLPLRDSCRRGVTTTATHIFLPYSWAPLGAHPHSHSYHRGTSLRAARTSRVFPTLPEPLVRQARSRNSPSVPSCRSSYSPS